MRSVLTTYPPSSYPKLYPKPVEYYKMGQRGFKLVNQFIFLLGFVILFIIAFVVDQPTFADDGFVSEAFPAVYGMIQFLPLYGVGIFGIQPFQADEKSEFKHSSKG